MPSSHNGRSDASEIRIGINAQLLSASQNYRRAGIHQYIAQVLQHLPLAAPHVTYRVYARDFDRVTDLNNSNLHAVATQWRTEQPLLRILWEQTAWPIAAVRDQLDLLHSMAFVTPIANRVPEIVTVYDLSFFKFPEAFPVAQRTYLQNQTARSVRGAQKVITISEASRQDIHSLFGVPLAQIEVIWPGVDDDFRPFPAAEVAAFRTKKGLPERMLLHVGTLQPRKNVPVLLQALAGLRRPGVKLFLIGGKGWMYDEIFALVDELGMREQVTFVGYVADEELPLWYNAASALVLPSVYEGFGLPVVEAMACGTPVVAARSSSIPEVGGDAAVYFDPSDETALTSLLAEILDDEARTAVMRERGLQQARKFSWLRAGEATAEVYRKVLLTR